MDLIKKDKMRRVQKQMKKHKESNKKKYQEFVVNRNTHDSTGAPSKHQEDLNQNNLKISKRLSSSAKKHEHQTAKDFED